MQIRLEKFWLSNQWKIYFWLCTSFALLMRLTLQPFESGDMKVFLIPWLEFLRNNHGFLGLSQEFSNYNTPYLSLLALVSYLPSWVPAVTCVKIVGVPFDFLSAFFVAKILQRCGHSIKVQTLAYFVILFLPTAILNSAVWGQCDGIYTSFLIITLYYLCCDRPSRAMIFFGVAISFKLQAIFFAPAFLALWLAKKISFRHFCIVPAVYLLSLLPAFAFGRSFVSLLSVYAQQAGYYKNLSLNAPNLYIWISDGDPYRKIADTYYDLFTPAGYLLTIVGTLFFGIAVLNRRVQLTNKMIVMIHFVSVLMMPFLLPKMHDRYFYPADVTSVLFAFCYPQLFFIPIFMQIASLSVYLNVLFSSTLLTPHWAALLVALTLCLAIKYFLKTIWSTSEDETQASPVNGGESAEMVEEKEPYLFTEKKVIVFLSIFALALLARLPVPGLLPSPGAETEDLFISIEGPEHQIPDTIKAVTVTQDWSSPKFGKDLNGNPLKIGGTIYDDSICVHASSLIAFDLSSKYKTFSGAAALPDYLLKEKAPTSVSFRVVGDGKDLWSSGPVNTKSSEPKIFPFLVDISGVNSLSLVVEPASPGIASDHGCWVLAKVAK